MNRHIIPAMFAALTLAAAPMSAAIAQGNYQQRPHVIPWSFADYQPNISRGQFTGLYIWHHRNTVHVETTDNHWFGDRFRGMIEIRHGSFDNVKGEYDRADTRFRQVAKNRLVFEFNAQDPRIEGFKFNIHDGDRLIFHVGLDGHQTGRIFYGGAQAPTMEDPVIFDLKK